MLRSHVELTKFFDSFAAVLFNFLKGFIDDKHPGVKKTSGEVFPQFFVGISRTAEDR